MPGAGKEWLSRGSQGNYRSIDNVAMRTRPAARLRRSEATRRIYIPPKSSEATPLPPAGDPERHSPRRWVVEVCHSWFNRFRQVFVRWEKRASLYLGFVQLAASLIIYRKLRKLRSLSG